MNPNSSTPWHRNLVIGVALLLPWINPFASAPSSGVIPLLLSWMMAACLVIAVSDVGVPRAGLFQRQWRVALVWAVALACLLLFVPRQVDHAVTLGLIGALTCIGLMIFVGDRARDARDELMPVLVAALMAAAAINALIGVLQYVDAAQALTPWVNVPYYKGDAFGNLRQRNQFGSLMSLGWMALWWRLAQAKKSPESQAIKLGYAAYVLLLAVGVSISMSRTGMLLWLSLPLLTLLWSWQQGRQAQPLYRVHWVWPLWALVAFVVAAGVMPYVALEVTGQMGASLLLRVSGGVADYSACAGRSVLWRNALEMLSQHPWLGWGWAQTDLAHFSTLYRSERFCDMLDNAHDLPLHIALELGLPFALSCVGLALMWVGHRTPWRAQTADQVMAWGLLWVIGIHSLLEYPLWYGPFQITAGLALGILWREQALTPATLAAAPNQPATQAPLTALILACLMFIGSLYAAWDFNRVSQIYKSASARDAVYQQDPLGAALQSWLFQNQAEFAKLTTTEVTADNAQDMYELALRLLSYSPEDRVVQRLISAAKLLGKEDQAQEWQIRLDAMRQSLKRQD